MSLSTTPDLNIQARIKKNKRKKIRKFIIWIVIIVAIIAGGYYTFKPKPKVYILHKVEQGKLLQTVSVQGTVTPKRQSLLTAPYNGYVKKIYVKVGQHVKVGQSVVSVAQDLQSTSPVFPLRSPYDGIITVIPVSEGEYVTKGDISNFLVEIDDLSSIFVKLTVTELNVYNLKVGQPADVRITSIMNKMYHGKVTDVSIAAETTEASFGSSQTLYPVKVSIDDPTPDIKPGMSSTVKIITNSIADTMYLPQQFVYDSGKVYYVIMADGTRKDIKVGITTNLNIQVLSGLKAGEEVRQVDYANLYSTNESVKLKKKKK